MTRRQPGRGTPPLHHHRTGRSPYVFFTIVALGIALASIAKASPEHAAIHNLGRGALHPVDRGPFDQVDLFNGNLHYAVSLGHSYPLPGNGSYQLSLHYNAQIWDFDTTSQGVAAQPVRDASAGLGWDLSLGRLHAPTEPSNASGRWLFVDRDGRQHRFYDTLQPGDVPVSGVRYSRDSRYLQLRDTGSQKEVRFPDGQRLTFDLTTAGWRLGRMANRYGTGASITYAPAGDRWTLTDDLGRQQVVHLMADPTGTYPSLVSSVDLSAAGGTSATYTLAYTTTTLTRPVSDTDPATPATVTVPLLTSVTLPDATQHVLAYHPDTPGLPAASGRLASATVPTLGRTEWTYADRAYPWLNCTANAQQHLADGAGVASRSLVNATGTIQGTWTYVATLDAARPKSSTCAQPRALTTTVTDPLGHQRRTHFSVFVSGDPVVPGGDPWWVDDYGMPWTKHQQDASGLLLSEEVITSGTTVRSLRLASDQDASQSCTPTCAERNPRVTVDRTIFHDDSNHFIQNARTGFDGYGHFTTTDHTSSFPGAVARSEQTVLAHDLGQWWLGLAVEHRVIGGGASRVVQWCLDPFGMPTLERRLAGAAEGAHDLVTRTTRDATGQTILREHFGGDTGPVATTKNLCNLTVGAPQYAQSLGYQAGVLNDARWLDAGAATVLRTIDRDIDVATGRMVASRAANGLETTYAYDLLGRMVETVRPQQHRSTVVYAAASGPLMAKETTTHRDGTTVLAKDRVKHDAFGRLAKRETRSETGTWAGTHTTYDALGQVTARTDALGRTTEWRDYGAFGRPGRVRPPAGSGADRVHTFAGVRIHTETGPEGDYLRTSDASLVEAIRTTVRTYDSHGQLVQVDASDGSTRSYTYDLDGRTVRTTTESAVDPPTVLGERHHDGRGFLVSTLNAQGQTTNLNGYDARGRLTRETGAHGTVIHAFDRAGRRVTVTEDGGPLLKAFVYATSNDPGEWGTGRLRQATRYNHGVPGLSGALEVADTYTYAGRGGRASTRTTTLRDGTGVRQIFTTGATYTPLGPLASVDYPHCDRSWNLTCLPKARTVTYGYHPQNQRRLESVTSQHNADPAVPFVANTTYAADGSIDRLTFTATPLFYQQRAVHPDVAGAFSEQSTCSVASCDHIRPMIYDSTGRLARAVGGPRFPEDLRTLPTGVPEPPTARASLVDLTSTVVNTGAPSCPTYQYDATGMVTRTAVCPGGNAVAPAFYFHVYDAKDRLIWRAASVTGTSLATIGHRWHLYDLTGRSARVYEKGHVSFTWVRDDIHRGTSLVGQIATTNGSEVDSNRTFVHVDPFGAPYARHRIENGVITGWTAW